MPADEQNSGVSKRRRDGEEDDEECGPGEHDGLEDEEEDGDEEEEDRDRSDDRLDAYIIEERMAKEEAETVEAVIDQYMERSKTEYVLVSLGGSVAGEVRGRECEDG
ncbi:hypothetical protein I350_06206 [Cryptococcus amylolentus CBS 6273]|uniref:Uncharacterized protein n=1 Tax=Cryptococcus amylolentus CBS 6273 TaxID=1296118 RepID=A0A1E3JMM9_9TREE|nr:hypothetical protein I350_06206 [Cryptococcus amylolentus CBS 6273]